MTHPARHLIEAVQLDAIQRPAHDLFARIQMGANEAATGFNDRRPPTELEAIAGNYKKGPFRWRGFRMHTENERNSVRSGTSPDGKRWENRMAAHYGDFPGTVGNDGDPVDWFFGLFPESDKVWVINQRNVSGAPGFDEHKVMAGFATEQQAIDAYNYSYDRDWKGLMSIVPCTVPQLRWWLKFGDKSRAFSPDLLPYEGPTMDKVLWDRNAQPVATDLSRVMYGLRVHDASDGLLLDAVTMDEAMADPDIEGFMVLDALVVEVSRMQRKMELLQRVMESAGDTVKPVALTIADPFKSRGVLQVMALFEMSDGQTIAIYFHNPDTTPAKLTPLDELISWKWLLNKKDVTIVVAPERGLDLNIREVARRVMRLVERNSAPFLKANAKAADRLKATDAIKVEIGALEVELVGLQRKITVAQVEKADRDAAVAANARAQAAEADRKVADPVYELTATQAEGFEIGKAVALGRGSFLPGDSAAFNEAAAKYAAMPAVMGWLKEGFRDGWDANRPAEAVTLTGAELGEFAESPEGVKAMRDAAQAALEPMLGEMVPCPALGGDVEIRRASINKTIRLSGDKRKLKLVPKLREIIGAARVLGSRKPYDGDVDTAARMYHTLRTEIALAESPLAVRVVVKEDVNGTFHYDMTVHAAEAIFDSAKEESPANRAFPVTSTNGGGTEPSHIARHQLGAIVPALDGVVKLDGVVLDMAAGDEVLNLFIEGEPAELAPADVGEQELSTVPVPSAYEMGRAAFAAGMPKAPAADPAMMPAHLQSGDQQTTFTALKDWDRGWTEASLDSRKSPLDRFEANGGEPWNVTQAKWVEIMTGHMASLGQHTEPAEFAQFHESAVKTALDAGQPVSLEVLADYPSMKAETAEEKEARYAAAEAALKNVVAKAGGEDESELESTEPVSATDEALQAAAEAGAEVNTVSRNLADPSLKGMLPMGYLQTADRGVSIALWSKGDMARAARFVVEAEHQSLFKPFDPDSLKMPTAAQLGLNNRAILLVSDAAAANGTPADNEVLPGWSNGHLLDLVKRPAFVHKAIEKNRARSLVGTTAIAAVSGKAKNRPAQVFPIASHDYDERVVNPKKKGAFDRIPKKTLVLVSPDGQTHVWLQTQFVAYFANVYKDAQFWAAGPDDSVEVRSGGKMVGVIMPMNNKGDKDLIKRAQRAVAIAANQPAAAAQVTPAQAVDAAYKFASASDKFKEWVADSLEDPDYSPFVSAREIDKRVHELGGRVAWDVSAVALDGVERAPSDASMFDDPDIERTLILDSVKERALACLPEGAVLDFAGDVSASIVQLQVALDVVTTNEPINRERGDIAQADLERRSAADFRRAIAVLQGKPVLDDASEGAYLNQSKDAIAASVKLLKHFRAFIRSDKALAKDPTSGWHGNTMTKAEAQRTLTQLIDIAVNRKGEKTLTSAQEQRYADYQHDARVINDYLTKRIRHTGSRNMLRVPEMKAAYPHIDNQPMFDAVEDVKWDTIVGTISRDDAVIGRALVGGDGKSMIYIGEVGTSRVTFPSGVAAMWSAADAAEMVDALWANHEAAKAGEAKAAEAEPVKATRREGVEAITYLREWVPTAQLKTMTDAMNGEEGAWFIDKAVEMANRIKGMPKTYGQNDVAEPIAHLHYFTGGADWYITEKDMEAEQLQAFGWADLGHGGELGYISIVDIVKHGGELDLHFDPKPLSAVNGKGAPEPEASEESQDSNIGRKWMSTAGEMEVIGLSGDKGYKLAANGQVGDTIDADELDERIRSDEREVREAAEESDKGATVDIAAKGDQQKAAVLAALVSSHGWTLETDGILTKTIGGGVTGGMVNPNGDRRIFAQFKASILVATWGDTTMVSEMLNYGEDPAVTAVSFNAKVMAMDKSTAAEPAPAPAATEPTVPEPVATEPVILPAADAEDRSYLQSMITGDVDLLDPGILDRMEPMFAKYEGNADMGALLEQAAKVYSDAAVAAARTALAG